jgi:hypothetical protein
MRRFCLWIFILSAGLMASCGKGGMFLAETPESGLEAAEHVLLSFFDALSREDYRLAASYHLTPNPLSFLYEDLDPENAEALLARACTPSEQSWCVFYCWKIKDVVSRDQVAFDEYVFHVRFEDQAGHLLVDGDNVTSRPCGPTGCKQEVFIYRVILVEGKYYVDGVPVFSGCWP